MDYCFSPPTFLSTGDKWRQPPHLPAKWRDKSRNFVTCSSKKGKTAANFGDGPCDYRGAYGPSLAHIVVNDRSMPRRRRNATVFTAPKGRYEAILNSSIRVRGGGRGGGGRHRAAAAPQRRNFTRRAPGVPLEQSFGGYLEPPRKKANASAPRPRRAGAARRVQKANASATRPAPRKPANRTIRTP